jgi:glycosyltransferase involved in cell wall biosynthesis
MVLATFSCALKLFFNYYLVVDRHTTFRLNKPHSGNFRTLLFMCMHRCTLKFADLTIVTNEYLADLVRKQGGRAFVLPDKLPSLRPKTNIKLKGLVNLLMISSFGQDEPLCEVVNAVSSLSKRYDFALYITGNYHKAPSEIVSLAPSNVIFTGYLPDQEFVNMLFSVDGVLALTTSDYCMLCGCYEAIAAKKPLITSDKVVLRDYFNQAIFVKNHSEDIALGIANLLDNINGNLSQTIAMHDIIKKRWAENFRNLNKVISCNVNSLN